jgi:hypothetical protein
MGTFTHVWQSHQLMCFPVACVGNGKQNGFLVLVSQSVKFSFSGKTKIQMLTTFVGV